MTQLSKWLWHGLNGLLSNKYGHSRSHKKQGFVFGLIIGWTKCETKYKESIKIWRNRIASHTRPRPCQHIRGCGYRWDSKIRPRDPFTFGVSEWPNTRNKPNRMCTYIHCKLGSYSQKLYVCSWGGDRDSPPPPHILYAHRQCGAFDENMKVVCIVLRYT